MRNILLYFLLIISIGAFSQTTYYVSNSGNDGALGTSPATAWQTIAKVNSTTFSAGDSILFERGSIWRMETLNPTNSGTANNYITYSNYGSGQLPKIFGSAGLTSFSAHPTLSNVYKGNLAVTTNPTNAATSSTGSIWYCTNDTTIWGDGVLQYDATPEALSINYNWSWRNDTIYFYYDGAIGDIDTVECAQIDRLVQFNSEYVTLDGLDLRYGGSRCIGTSVYPENTRQGMQIRNCHIAYSCAKEQLGYGIALFHSQMIIENNNIHDNGRRNISINITSDNNQMTMRDVYIQDNWIHDGYHTTGVDMGISGTGNTVRNIHIRRNRISEHYGLEKGAWEGNFVFVYGYGNITDIDSVYIYNNLFQNVNATGIFAHNANNITVVNNTFTGPATDPNSGGWFYTPSGTNHVNYTIMNNLFLGYSSGGITGITGAGDGSTVLDTLDYNLWADVDDGTFGSYLLNFIDGQRLRYPDWATIQGLGYETNSKTPSQFPHLVDSINDLHLKSTSPAIEAGTPISFVTTDYDGNLRDATTPDIGAFEYGTISIDSSATEIETFNISGQVSSIVTSVDSTVNVVMPNGTNLANLSFTATYSTGAIASLESPADFTTTVNDTITALKLNTQIWTINVTVQEAPVIPTETPIYLKSNNGNYLINRSGSKLNHRK